MRIGVLASVGHMIDSFFSDMMASWTVAGHQVTVAAGTGTRDGSARIIEGLTRRPGPGVIKAWSGLRAWVQDDDLDVVITNTATASALARTARLQAPIVYFCHGLHWNRGRSPVDRLWQASERLLLRHTAAVITINSDDHAWFARRFAEERILRLPSGVGLTLDSYPPGRPLSAQRGEALGTLRLLWIGEFTARKRPHLALAVAGCLRRSGLDFTLEMLGDGPLLESVNSEIRRLGLIPQVTASGIGETAQALAASHALIHTSEWEGLPRVMLEALAVGRPTYAFDVKGVRDIPESVLIPDGETSLLAGRIGRDWRSGRLLDPLTVDREALDVSHPATSVRTFLEDTVVRPGGSAVAVTSGDIAGPCRKPTIYEVL